MRRHHSLPPLLALLVVVLLVALRGGAVHDDPSAASSGGVTTHVLRPTSSEEVIDEENEDGTGTTVVLSNQNDVHALNSKYAIKEEASKQRSAMEAKEKREELDKTRQAAEARVKAETKELDERGVKTEEGLKKDTADFKKKLAERGKLLDEKAAEKTRKTLEKHKTALRKMADRVKEQAAKTALKTDQLKQAHAQLKAAGGELELTGFSSGGSFLEIGAGVAVGSRFQKPQAYLVAGRLAVVEGLLSGEGMEGFFGRLPRRLRPKNEGRLVFSLMRGNKPARVDVLADGRMYLHRQESAASWLSLSGLAFDVAGGQSDANLLNGWTSFGDGYRKPTQGRIGDVCLFSGLARPGEWSKSILQLERSGEASHCAPRRRYIFNGPQTSGIVRIDLVQNPAGALSRVAGAVSQSHMSLDSVMWPASGGKPFSLGRGWANYGKGYASATYSKTDTTFCLVTGLVKYNAGTWNTRDRVVGRLPVGCRPRRRHIFSVNGHEGAVRLDVLPNGHILWLSRARHSWVSLAGIRFISYQ